MVGGKVVCPGGGTPDKSGVCPVIPKTPTGGSKPAPVPTPQPQPQPDTSSVPLLAIAGVLLVGGVGYMVYRKKKQRSASYAY